MEELNRRLTYLFSLVGLLVCLGKFDRQVETYVLTDTGLILKQDAVHIEPDINYAQEILSTDELTPVQSENKVAEVKESERTPASAISFHIPKLGTKRKPRTMIAAGEVTPSIDPSIERSQKLEINPSEIRAMLSRLPQDREALASMTESDRTIALDLFEDTSLDAIIDHVQPTPNGGFVAQGHISGMNESNFQMVQENGETVANIFSTLVQYEVRADGGAYVVHQINPMKAAVLAATAPPAQTPATAKNSTTTPAKVATADGQSGGAMASAKPAAYVCKLQLQSPNGKEVLSQSLGEKVLWVSENAGREVRIKLMKGDQDLGTLARAANDGSTLMRIPTLIDPDSDYRIRIESSDDPNCFDESDEAFSIVP